jgi:HAD superfamily hydrolase (TIGR01509 family)
MPLSAALWDLDGTIVDTAPFHWLAWRDTLAAEGRPLTYERFAATFGLRNDLTVPALLDAEVSDAEIARIGDAKEARFRERVAAQPPAVLPGVLHWLSALRSAGWRQALATMAPRPNLEVIVASLELGTYFETAVASEDVERGKPDPQVFLLAAQRLGVPPERCVAVEDTAAGAEAARRAGMRCIGVNRSSAGMTADLLVPALDELPPDAFARLVNGS